MKVMDLVKGSIIFGRTLPVYDTDPVSPSVGDIWMMSMLPATPPSGISVDPYNTQDIIYWNANSTEEKITSYNIYWSTTTGVTKITGTKIAGITSPYTHTGLTNGNTIYYIITAVNNLGESVASSELNGTPNAYALADYFTATNNSAPDATKWNTIAYGTTLDAASTLNIQSNALTAYLRATTIDTWNGKGIVSKNIIPLGTGRTINVTMGGLGSLAQLYLEFCIAPTTWAGSTEDLSNFVKIQFNNGLYVIKKVSGTRTILLSDTVTAGYKTGSKTLTLIIDATNITVKDGATTITTQAHGLSLGSGFYVGMTSGCAYTTFTTTTYDTLTVQ